MDIPSPLLSYRPRLHAFVRTFLENRTKKYRVVGFWSADAIGRLTSFILGGKAIRGSLALFAYDAFSKGKNTKNALPLAAALELFHAAFLIEDDVMDQDEMRHGKATIHRQYTKAGQTPHAGESLAINVAGLAIFCGYDVLSQSEGGAKLFGHVSRELAPVTIAQMHDVAPGASPNVEDILRTYRFKTARYTFSLPLSSGAILAGAPSSTVQRLEAVGEHIGILFQIRDDELGVGGNEKETGKPVGTDAREGRQTLVSLAGNLEKIKKEHTEEANKAIAALPVSDANKHALLALVRFIAKRDR